MTCEAKLYNPTGCNRLPMRGRGVCSACASSIVRVMLQYIPTSEYIEHCENERENP